MAATLPPGIGNPQQAQQATAFIREQPWYANLLKTWGLQNPPPGVNGGNPVNAQGQPAKLSDQQQQQLIATAQQAGVGISDRYSIDENGQIAEPDSHMLRNLAIGAGLAASLFIPGVTEAIVGGLGAAGSAVTSGLGALGGAGGVGAGVSTAIGAGSKIAGLLGIGQDTANTYGAQQAGTANQLANNRIAAAKVDQGGPAADQTAFRNAMRAGLVAKMNPNATPGTLNGHPLPSLANQGTVDYANTMFNSMATRQAAGQTPTEFGVPPPTQAELDASSNAKTAGTVSNVIGAGSKIAGLFGLLKNGIGGDPNSVDGGVAIPGGEFDPNVVYG